MPLLVSVLPADLSRARGGGVRYAFELQAALAGRLMDWTTRGVVVASRDEARYVPPGWTAVGGAEAGRRPPGDAISVRTALACVPPETRILLCHGWRCRATIGLRAWRRFRPHTAIVAIDYGGGSRLGSYLSWIPLPRADVGAHISEFEQTVSPVAARRHIVVRGGVDPARFHPARREKNVDFLMVGRILPFKGQLRFLESLPSGARARLIGPSDSEDPAYLRSVLDCARALGVEVTLDASDDQLAAAYHRARYVVQVPVDLRRYKGAAPPELLGLTMLEGMASGSVPICPATGASAEFVRAGETGLTYELGSGSALVSILAEALVAENRYDELSRGALREAGRWTWDTAAKTLLSAVPGIRTS